ncbi:MAG: ABC transporter ATP-binding protein [Alphaproteobacteria bacterium]|nr:ABC transporter ATP-binding protein [Alphaproteobacteria bacterium]
MLDVAKLTAGYGPIDVIHGIDLNIAGGETVALLGPNGAGKSTLLAALTGTIRRRAGMIDFDGLDLGALDSHRIVAAGLTLVPEGRLIFGPFTVRDNLRLGALKLQHGEGRSQDERFDYVYALFPRLKERAGQLAGTLSGGEQQMLAIGRALMSAPRVLLLDEPFLGLAPLVVEEIRRALKALQNEGLTILLVEQKLDIALAFARRAYVMIKGRIVLEETSSALLARDDLATLYFDLAEDGE